MLDAGGAHINEKAGDDFMFLVFFFAVSLMAVRTDFQTTSNHHCFLSGKTRKNINLLALILHFFVFYK